MNAHCSPERLETRKHVHTTAETRHRSHTAHASRNAGPTRTHGNIGSQACGGAFATAAVVRMKAPDTGEVTIALACTQATAQIVRVAVHGTSGAHGQHWHASVWANLRVGHCSRRCGRSSEPGCEAGTHPWDGHGSTLSSALRHGHGERHEQRCR